ncbi:MAG: SDR family oxidoreductase [Clostridia bacterium]|nr:SDR family oxidoreductase [Clostridia bacterium]
MEFQGKTALITGASVGIGRAVALLMAERGADLLLLDLHFEKLQAVAEELKPFGRRVEIARCDVSNEEEVHRIVNRFGTIDILVNNAALWRDTTLFAEADTALWRRYLDVNVMGVVHCTQAVLSGMLERGYGRIVNIGSVAGVYGNRKMVHYSATKGALIAMTKALANEVT